MVKDPLKGVDGDCTALLNGLLEFVHGVLTIWLIEPVTVNVPSRKSLGSRLDCRYDEISRGPMQRFKNEEKQAYLCSEPESSTEAYVVDPTRTSGKE